MVGEFTVTPAFLTREIPRPVACHTVDMANDEYVLVVNQQNSYSRTVTANMVIGKEHVNFQLDSGATVNVLPESEYTRVTGDSNLQHLDHAESKLLINSCTTKTTRTCS